MQYVLPALTFPEGSGVIAAVCNTVYFIPHEQLKFVFLSRYSLLKNFIFETEDTSAFSICLSHAAGISLESQKKQIYEGYF